MMELYNNIRDYRKKANLTQEQLAEAMGVTGASVSKWENGQSAPDLGLLTELADFFGISVDALLGHRVREDRLVELEHQVEELVKQGNLEEACTLAEQILRNYPNSYSAVEHMAHHYYMMFMHTHEKRHMERAIELTRRLFALLNGPEDKRRIGLYTSIANQYELLGELGQAVEFYEKGNVDQCNDRSIAHCYVRMGKMDKALPMVSDRFLNHLFQLFQYVMDLSEIWQAKGEKEKALSVVEWCAQVMTGVTASTGAVPVSLNVVLLFQQAALQLELGDHGAAEETVRRMVRELQKPETAPEHSFLMPTTPLDLVGNLPRSVEQLLPMMAGEEWEGLRAVVEQERNR